MKQAVRDEDLPESHQPVIDEIVDTIEEDEILAELGKAEEKEKDPSYLSQGLADDLTAIAQGGLSATIGVATATGVDAVYDTPEAFQNAFDFTGASPEFIASALIGGMVTLAATEALISSNPENPRLKSEYEDKLAYGKALGPAVLDEIESAHAENIGNQILEDNSIQLNYNDLRHVLKESEEVIVRDENIGKVKTLSGEKASRLYEALLPAVTQQYVEELDEPVVYENTRIGHQISIGEDSEIRASFHLPYNIDLDYDQEPSVS